MKKFTLNEEIAKMRKIMGLKENYDTYFDTSYEDNWQKGGGPEEEEMRTATLKNNPFDKSGKTYVLVDDEDGEEYSERYFQLMDSMEEVDKMRQQTRIENTYIVKNEVGEDKIAVTFPYTPSRSEFAGMFDEAEDFDLSSVDNPNAYTDDIINHNAERGEGPSHFDFQEAQEIFYNKEVLTDKEAQLVKYFMPKKAEAYLFHNSRDNTYLNLYLYSEADKEEYDFKRETGGYSSEENPKETVSENEMGEKKYDQSHGSPYDRGRADSWYRRPSSPHKWPEGTGHGEKVTDLTPEEIEAYEAGYEDNERHGGHKEWD
jgi:hypothetical protein